tara:strand:+ start:476 stop:1021 length:546 start_codon:yes stop_codon:yes gene_type:complete
MKKIALLTLLIPVLVFSQTHSIDQYTLQMSGNTTDNDISINTFYNPFDTCNISWQVIKDSIPNQWDFSFCFPNCYAPGVINGYDVFFPNNQTYLNCHMYPNGQAGYGIIQMEITTNGMYKDTVTWTGYVSGISSINEAHILDESNVNQIYDLSGRKVNVMQNAGVYIIEYKNHYRRKVFLQ